MIGMKWVHRGGSLVATLLIAVFFTATLLTELFGTLEGVKQVKQLIVVPGLFLLVPSIAVAGITGNLMTRGRKGKILTTKKRRLLIVAVTGLFILLPAALWLRHLAFQNSFGTLFYLVQTAELLAGASNLTLMSLNIYDGMKLAGRVKRKRKRVGTVQP